MNPNSLRPVVCVLLCLIAVGNLTMLTASRVVSAQAGGRIQGTVYGYNECNQLVTLGGAIVTVTGATAPSSGIISTSTGSSGEYGLYLSAGAYTLTASLEGYESQSFTVAVSDASLNTVNFALERAKTLGPIVSSNSCTTSSLQTTTVFVVISTSVETTTVTTIPVASTEAGTSIESTYLQISSNSTISNLQFDSGRKMINFTASGPSGTVGSTSVVFAKALISGTPIVLIDNGNTSPISIALTSNSTHYYLTVTYPHSTHSITIGGSNNIPEFDNLTEFILAAVLICVFVALSRRMERGNAIQRTGRSSTGQDIETTKA